MASRKHTIFRIPKEINIKEKLVEWSKNYQNYIWFDSNGHTDPYGSFEAALALVQTDKSQFFIQSIDELQEFVGKGQDWLFGYFSYDLKNDFEQLVSQNFDALEFPKMQFFVPTKLIFLKQDEIHFHYLESFKNEILSDLEHIQQVVLTDERNIQEAKRPKIHMRIHKDAYFEKVNSLLGHIHRGDIYEANLCQEFYATETILDPWQTYSKLNKISQPPFATFMRMKDKFLMCASPERYLKKMGQKVISQPIKGTAPRGNTILEDEAIKKALENDEKERAENIMITDLVRNDLSRSAQKGTVEVEELCRVYPYKQVHQMISTIVSKVRADKNPVELIQETFPMGSMTGTPKISAMRIIEELEETKRGFYSGAVGYFDPNGDFDFNVVIRSILYNSTKKYVSYSVGSAITAKSIPEREYEECLLKAKAMRKVLEQD